MTISREDAGVECEASHHHQLAFFRHRPDVEPAMRARCGTDRRKGRYGRQRHQEEGHMQRTLHSTTRDCAENRTKKSPQARSLGFRANQRTVMSAQRRTFHEIFLPGGQYNMLNEGRTRDSQTCTDMLPNIDSSPDVPAGVWGLILQSHVYLAARRSAFHQAPGIPRKRKRPSEVINGGL